MARGFDELLEFLLEEIALRGEQGASSSDFKDLLLKFYTQPHESEGSGKAPATRAPPHIDRRLQEKIWGWLTGHRDICIENYHHQDTPPSLAEFERLENAQPAQNDEPTSNPPEGDASADAQAKTKAPRLFVNEDRMWQAITGHGVDPKKVPRHEFIILSIIAAHGEEGVVQPEITRISGQDKRSVPRRTDNLQKNGYITKTHVLAKGTRTSRCTLKKFAKAQVERRKALPNVDYSSPPELIREVIFEGGLLIYDRFFDVLMDILKQCTIITFDDCKTKLGIKTKTWEMKSLWRSMRRLEGLGLVKKVKAQIKGMVTTQKWYRCIKLTRQPTSRDRVVFVTMSMRAANKIKNELAEAGGEEDAEHDVDMVEEEEQDGAGAVQAPLAADNDVEEIVRLPPQWDPDRPLTNLFWEVIDESGPGGTTTSIIRSRALGPFYKRPVDSMLGRISDIWHISQPRHLRHFAVVRDTGISGKYIHYIYRSFANFQLAVDQGEAAWEVVVTQPVNPNVSKIKPRAKGGKHIREKAQTDYGPMDEWGFPQIAPVAFQGQHGMATLEDSHKAILDSGIKSCPSRGYVPRFITNGYSAGARQPDSDDDGDSSFTASPKTKKSKPRAKHTPRIKKPGVRAPLLKKATAYAQAQRDSQHTPEAQISTEVAEAHPSSTGRSPSNSPRRPRDSVTSEVGVASPLSISSGKRYRMKVKAEKAARVELWEEGKKARGVGLDDPIPRSEELTEGQDTPMADAPPAPTGEEVAGDNTEPNPTDDAHQAQDEGKLTGRQRQKLRLEAERTRQAEEARRRQQELEMMGIDAFAIAERADIIFQRMVEEEEQALQAAGNTSQPGVYINPPGSQKPRDPTKRGRPKKALVAVIVLPALRGADVDSPEFAEKVEAARARNPQTTPQTPVEDSPPPSPRPHQSNKRPKLYTPAEIFSDETAQNDDTAPAREPSVMIEDQSTARTELHPSDSPNLNSKSSIPNDLQNLPSNPPISNASHANTPRSQENPPVFLLLDEIDSGTSDQLKAVNDGPSAPPTASLSPHSTSSPSKITDTLPKDPPPPRKRGRPRKNPEALARPRKAAKKKQGDTAAQATPHDSPGTPHKSPVVPHDTPTKAASKETVGVIEIDAKAKAPPSTDSPQPPQQAPSSLASTPAAPVQQNQRGLESYFSREKTESANYQSPYAMPAGGTPRHEGLYDSNRRTSKSAQGVYRSPYAPKDIQTPPSPGSAAVVPTAHPAPGPVAGQFSHKPRATPLQTSGWTSINTAPREDVQSMQDEAGPAQDDPDLRASTSSITQSQCAQEQQDGSETDDEVFERILDTFNPRSSRTSARKTSLSKQKSPANKSPTKNAATTENTTSHMGIQVISWTAAQKTTHGATSTGEEDNQQGAVGDDDTEMQDAPLVHEETETPDRIVLASQPQEDGHHEASLNAQASEPVPEEPVPVEQEPKWTGPTLRKGKERAANEPFVNPNPSEVPIKHKKGKWQQGRKQGVKLGSGGILNFNRGKLLCDIIEQCNGVFPGDFEIQRPFIGLWKKEHGADRLVDRDTVKRTIKNAVDTGKIRRLTYTFKDKKGVLVSRHILTLPHIDPKSPLVLETQRKVIEAMPRVYWPPEMKHYEDELGNSWYGERYERETELQVQRESLPQWMRDTQLKSAEDHKRREADLKRSLQKETRGPPRPRGSTRGRARGGTLRGRATGRVRLAGLPRPRAGSDAEKPWSAVDTAFHIRSGSAHGLPEMSELPQFTPAERRGSFAEFQTDNFVIEDPSAAYERYSDDDSAYSRPGTPRGRRGSAKERRGSISSIASSLYASPRRRGSHVQSSTESTRRDYFGARRQRKPWDSPPAFYVSPQPSRRSSFAELDSPSRPGTPSGSWCNIGPEYYDPTWEVQQITTLTDPDQRFHPSSGTFSTDYVVIRNARLSCWTPAHRIPREDYQRQFEDMMPRSLACLKKQTKMKGKQRNHSRRENPYLSMLEREILEIRSWERSLKPVDRDPVYAKFRVREPHFINHNFYGEHITPDFDMSSTPMFADYWSEHYTINEPPPLDLDEDDDEWEPFIPCAVPVGPPAAKRFRRKTVVNTPDTRPTRPLVKKFASATSSRNPFADPSCVITTADTKKLLYTMVVVQSLIGGLDKTTSWEVVRRVFDTHPRWDYPAFRNRWTWLKMHCAQVMEKLFDDFQKAFLLAYECGDVPSLNYKSPHDYDWPYIVEWAMQNITVKPPREIDPNSDLPASREELDARFIVEEITDRVDPPKETLFYEATLAARRKELSSEYAFYIPLTLPDDPAPNPKRKGFSEAAIEKAKSWVRATIVAPNHMFNAAAAKERLSRFNDKLIEKATNDLIGSKWFRNEHKGRGNRPGRQYGPDKNFAKAFERQLQATHLIDAMRFKTELDDAFSNGAEAYPVRGAANDGTVLATINLLNNGHVKFVPRLPEVNHTVGAPFPRLTKFGFTEGHYKTVQMDRTRTHWDIDVVPTERYVYGNPLLKAKGSTNLPHKLPLPAQGSEFEGWIPIWYDVQLAPIREWWCRVVAGVLHVIFGRPGISAKGIHKAFKEAIGEWEVELCLEWMKEMGVIKELRLGLDDAEMTRGWRLGEWWWCCLGPEAMMETACG